MNKMTDNEIIKALEYRCSDYECRDLVFYRNIFDLINRQKAEIEILKEKNRNALRCSPKAIRRAKAEARKEFAEMVKAKCAKLITYRVEVTGIVADTEYRIPSEFIDDIVKKMVGE